MSIVIKTSELMKIFQWLTAEEACSIRSNDEFTHLKEELSNVMIYCLSLANQLNIDIATSIEDKIEKNGKKYPTSIK